MNLIKIKNQLIDLSVQAGEEILKIYENFDNSSIQLKTDDSPLTLADKASNSVICKGLERITPSIPVVSEENKEIDYGIRKNYEYLWMVDPLDGTKEFIKKNGEFTTNIALIHNGFPILGVVHVPVAKQSFWGIQGVGAFEINAKGEEKKLTVSRINMKDRGLKVVCSRSHLNEETQKFIDQLEEPISIQRGSSLKFLAIAIGEAELYPRIAPTMEWDTAAAQAVLEAAGGFVQNYYSKERLRYNKENLLNPNFLAGVEILT